MRPLAIVLILAGLTASACGGDGRVGDGGGPRVVATTTQLADIARQVVGPEAVEQILEPGADPHDYEPRPSDVRALEKATVILRSGGDLDDWLEDLIDSAGTDARVVDAMETVGGGDDPHWWQDPRNTARVVTALTAAVGSPDYGQAAAAYRGRLKRLDASVAACISKLPPSQRKLVTTHDALGHYADRYGLDVIGAVIPSLSSQAQPSSKDVGELVDQIREQKVKAIFPESSLNSKLERAISRESGAAVGGELWADTLGPEGSSGETYIGSIEANTRAIAGGLSGGAIRCF